jgi:hypothetical protein
MYILLWSFQCNTLRSLYVYDDDNCDDDLDDHMFYVMPERE